MRRCLLSSLFLAVLVISPCIAKADGSDADHQAAARELLQTMHMDKLLADSTNTMLDMQIKQNPALEPYRQVMLDFLKKYMGWDATKDDLAKLYADEFSIEELNQMTTFYKTPAGQKLVSKQSELMTKGAEFGQKRVADHTDELRQAIEAETKKNGAK
jgi:hypothetical protein